MRQGHKSGFGLVEVLIASSLGLLLLGLLHRFLVPVLRASNKIQVQAQLSQEANVTLSLLARDFRASNGSGLSYLEATETEEKCSLAICRRDGLSAEGRQLYEERAAVYYWSLNDGRVKKREWPSGSSSLPPDSDPSRPLRLSNAQLNEHFGLGTQAKILAQDVTDFRPVDKWPVGSSVTMAIRLEKLVPAREKPVVLELSKTIAFRNR